MEEFRQGFIDEALQLTDKLEGILIELEGRQAGVSDIQEIFRIMHTIKGSSSMFAFKNTEFISHSIEDIYALIRDGKLELTSEIINLTIQSNDIVKSLLQNNDVANESGKIAFDTIIQQASKFVMAFEALPGMAVNLEPGTLPEIKNKETVYYILFKPDTDILLRGITPVSVFEELEEVGKLTGFPYIEDIPLPHDFDPSKFYLAWDIFVKTNAGRDELEDCFMFYLSHEYKIVELSSLNLLDNKEFLSYCINLNKEIISIETIQAKLQVITGKDELEIPVEKSVKKELDTNKKSESKNVIDSIKVDSLKLDELINLVSELVTLNSRFELIAQKTQNEDLLKAVRSLSKLSKRFRDNALDLRLIPVKVLVLKMQRLIRDLSIDLKKDVEFITEGTNTELDKNIIAKLEGPLIHILRNSLDHGIELPADREKLNKPRKGVIRFVAFYSGSNVYIQVQDDGRGIDLDLVKQKAIEKGLIQKSDSVSKQEIINLLFTPGFSTAENVTNISGRGVGLDVVKKEITDMRGEIDIESEKNLGTSFTLKLPLTLSIIDTLMVQIDKTKILIPREYIVNTEIFSKLQSDEKVDKIGFKGKVIPLISLREDFLADTSTPLKQHNVIISQYDKFYALTVDKIIGEHQAVVKPLGFYSHDHEYFSGASILGDGSLAFILDINKVISNKKNKSKIGNFNIK